MDSLLLVIMVVFERSLEPLVFTAIIVIENVEIIFIQVDYSPNVN